MSINSIELSEEGYPIFTPEMKETHTILIPTMLEIHFELLISVFGHYGYHCEILRSESRKVVEEGLKNVHNDTCYPALLCIGLFMEALKSGKYDPDRTSLNVRFLCCVGSSSVVTVIFSALVTVKV